MICFHVHLLHPLFCLSSSAGASAPLSQRPTPVRDLLCLWRNSHQLSGKWTGATSECIPLFAWTGVIKHVCLCVVEERCGETARLDGLWRSLVHSGRWHCPCLRPFWHFQETLQHGQREIIWQTCTAHAYLCLRIITHLRTYLLVLLFCYLC